MKPTSAYFDYRTMLGFVRIIERGLLGAFFLGVKHARPKQIVLADDWPQAVLENHVNFEEAERIVRSQIPVTKAEFSTLEKQMRYRAFTVAALTSLDAINAVRKQILRSLRGGMNLQQFIKETSDVSLLNAAGFARIKPWYWETVFRTNLHTAYSAGRALQDTKTPPRFYKFSANIDSRTSAICSARNGIVRKATDPYWDSNTPPLHHNCRSTRIGISETLAEAYDITETPLPTKARPAQRGFGANPLQKENFWKLTPAMKQRAISYGMAGDIVHLAHMLGMNNYALELVRGTNIIKRYENGGRVHEAQNREEKSKHQKRVRASERESADALAQRREKVYLLPETKTPGIKNPDAIVGDKMFDFKSVSSTNAKNIAKLIYNTSRDQAQNVMIRIGDAVNLETLKTELHGQRTKYIHQVWILQGDKLTKLIYK